MRSEVLDGDNCVECQTCGKKKTPHDKGLALSDPPYLLQLQLKRFVFNYTTMAREKLDDRVTFPLVLDLNPFVEKQRRPDGDAIVGAADEVTAAPSPPADVDMHATTSVCTGVEVCTAPGGVSAAVTVIDIAAADGVSDVADDPMTPQSQIMHTNMPVSASASAAIKPGSSVDEQVPPPAIDPIEQAARLVKSNGPHVYELYSVLVHSGSANGGHYYAYVMVRNLGSSMKPAHETS